jgi:hypothetical protein
MTNFEQLTEKLQELCKPRDTDHGRLDQDLCIHITGETHLRFLTRVFPDGCFLGWYSHSPWGHVHDQEQGWTLFSPELEVLDEIETRVDGQSAGNNFRQWRAGVTLEHGRAFKLKPEWDNEQFWKITDVL